MSGANSRRIRKALKPLLGEEHLSKSAVSRVVSRLKERFEEWQNRALSEEVYAIVYLDGFHLKVRMAKRVISVPVLVALGVAPDGQKRLLSLRLAVSEASTHWGSVLEGVVSKNTNELKTGSPGRFGIDVSPLGSPMGARILGHEHAGPALDLVGGRHRWLDPA